LTTGDTRSFGDIGGGTPVSITGAAAAPAGPDVGYIRLTVTSTSGWTTGDTKIIHGVTGTTEANGTWKITVIDGTTIDLGVSGQQSSTFVRTYISGGQVLVPHEANGQWVVTVIDSTHLDLLAVPFVNSYVSGGAIQIAHVSAIGYLNRKLMGAAKARWGTQFPFRSASDLKCGFGAWTVFGFWSAQIWQDQGLGGDELSDVGYNTFPNRPRDKSDHIYIAPYIVGPNTPNFSGGYVGGGLQQQLYDNADLYNSGDHVTPLDWMKNDFTSGTGGNGDTETLDTFFNPSSGGGIYASWEAIMAHFDGDGSPTLLVEQYEGGPHIGSGIGDQNYPSVALLNSLGIDGSTYGGPGGRLDVMFTAWRASKQCRDLTIQWANLGYDSRLPHSGAVCWYVFCDGFSIWPLFEGDLNSTKRTYYDGVKHVNTHQRLLLTRST
jgi:hypothetical protein